MLAPPQGDLIKSYTSLCSSLATLTKTRRRHGLLSRRKGKGASCGCEPIGTRVLSCVSDAYCGGENVRIGVQKRPFFLIVGQADATGHTRELVAAARLAEASPICQ